MKLNEKLNTFDTKSEKLIVDAYFDDCMEKLERMLNSVGVCCKTYDGILAIISKEGVVGQINRVKDFFCFNSKDFSILSHGISVTGNSQANISWDGTINVTVFGNIEFWESYDGNEMSLVGEHQIKIYKFFEKVNEIGNKVCKSCYEF